MVAITFVSSRKLVRSVLNYKRVCCHVIIIDQMKISFILKMEWVTSLEKHFFFSKKKIVHMTMLNVAACAKGEYLFVFFTATMSNNVKKAYGIGI